MKTIKKTYVDNSYFIEFADEIATQLTELYFNEDTFELDEERDEMGFTEQSKKYHIERYFDTITMLNSIMGVHSSNDKLK
jgi:hypothetical protein